VRIAVIDTLYPAFVAEHYARRPELRGATFAEQHAALIGRSFGTSDAYSANLRALGHEAIDVLANCAPVQSAWAREHGAGLRSALRAGERAPGRAGLMLRSLGLGSIVVEQVRAFGADVVYCQDISVLPLRDLARLRRDGRLIVGQIASPLPGDDRLRAYDLLLSSFPHFVERFRALGVDAEYLRIAFDERVLDRLRALGVDPDPAAPAREGAAFAGGLDPAVHGDGVALLERVLRDVPDLAVHGYGAGRLPAASAVRRAWRGEVWGLDMYAVLARARIVLNRHIDVAEGVANNMRLYEATGAGALLMTETAPNLAELFEPGTEVVAYRDADDLVALLRGFLADDDARREIAAAGQRRTLSEHTYAHRMRELAGLLEARR
jgi:hypothetical protein